MFVQLLDRLPATVAPSHVAFPFGLVITEVPGILAAGIVEDLGKLH
jgi:hypothetical protein